MSNQTQFRSSIGEYKPAIDGSSPGQVGRSNKNNRISSIWAHLSIRLKVSHLEKKVDLNLEFPSPVQVSLVGLVMNYHLNLQTIKPSSQATMAPFLKQ